MRLTTQTSLATGVLGSGGLQLGGSSSFGRAVPPGEAVLFRSMLVYCCAFITKLVYTGLGIGVTLASNMI